MELSEYRRMFEAEDRYWWYVSRRRLALRLLRRFGGKFERLLDLGCGTGAATLEFNRIAPTLGLDFSAEALRLAADRPDLRLVQGDAQAIPLRSESFDGVVTLDTLEHVPDDQRALAEIARVLRPGGILILNVPAYRWLWGSHDVALMHFRRYTRGEVKRALEAAGFDVAWLTYSIFALFPFVLAQRGWAKARPRKGVRLPPVGPLNGALIALLDAEGWLLERVSLPWGSSVTAVARKREHPQCPEASGVLDST